MDIDAGMPPSIIGAIVVLGVQAFGFLVTAGIAKSKDDGEWVWNLPPLMLLVIAAVGLSWRMRFGWRIAVSVSLVGGLLASCFWCLFIFTAFIFECGIVDTWRHGAKSDLIALITVLTLSVLGPGSFWLVCWLLTRPSARVFFDWRAS
ncbi:hypothetical protein Pla175_01240 [Pirellulimonas nuda]|uniref:Uncharacterized protein n=2 Tax=Pirellulimonas nuda TaxID=2528009 RepID=A0A518D5M7_9BACT|nr:hypothetical protein Pla175_01240 [Pirellulimonas nuda]